MTGRRAIAMALLAALLEPGTALGDEAPKKPESPVSSHEPAKPTAPAGPVYVPPPRERPRRRIGGGVRGPEAQLPRLYSLVPRHNGLTSFASPSLYWWIDAPPPADTRLALYLVNDITDETLLRVPLARPAAGGTHRVRLADHGVELQPGVEYEWSVALERGVSAEQLLVASGWIERTTPSAVGTAPGADAVTRYAQQGLWYDALAAAAERSDAEALDALLEQVGLGELAGP
jgi:hypothetical protein